MPNIKSPITAIIDRIEDFTHRQARHLAHFQSQVATLPPQHRKEVVRSLAFYLTPGTQEGYHQLPQLRESLQDAGVTCSIMQLENLQHAIMFLPPTDRKQFEAHLIAGDIPSNNIAGITDNTSAQDTQDSSDSTPIANTRKAPSDISNLALALRAQQYLLFSLFQKQPMFDQMMRVENNKKRTEQVFARAIERVNTDTELSTALFAIGMDAFTLIPGRESPSLRPLAWLLLTATPKDQKDFMQQVRDYTPPKIKKINRTPDRT